MRLLILNGPNLNWLGKREPHIYGLHSFDSYLESLRPQFAEAVIEYLQTNLEGEMVNALQRAEGVYDGVILNPGGYTHTSVAISDTLAAMDTPVVEVHISNLHAREEIRHQSLTGRHCRGVITGFGLDVYKLGMLYFTAMASE